MQEYLNLMTSVTSKLTGSAPPVHRRNYFENPEETGRILEETEAVYLSLNRSIHPSTTS